MQLRIKADAQKIEVFVKGSDGEWHRAYGHPIGSPFTWDLLDDDFKRAEMRFHTPPYQPPPEPVKSVDTQDDDDDDSGT